MTVRSNKLRQSARGETCTLRLCGCGFDDGTIVLCHVPGTGQKGIGTKCSDVYALYACHSCHDIIDGRKPGNWDFRDIVRAWAETLGKLIDKGLICVK